MWYATGKITHGEEYNDGKTIDSCVITHSNCEYCNEHIIQVKDDARNSHFGYLGNQAVIGKNYLYSPSIEAIRKFYDVGWENYKEREMRAYGPSFTQELGNNLLNVHSRLHVRRKGSRTLIGPWNYQTGDGYRLLCNNCFKKTYKRISIAGSDDLIYDITVLPHEALEQVIEECQVIGVQKQKGKIILL